MPRHAVCVIAGVLESYESSNQSTQLQRLIEMSQYMRFWHLSHRPTGKACMSLCICPVLSEPLLLKCTIWKMQNDGTYGQLSKFF